MGDGQWAGTMRAWQTAEEAIAQLRRKLDPLVGLGSELHIERLNILTSPLPDSVGSIAVANVDVDMFEATEAALAAVAPRLVIGGMGHCVDPSGTPMLAGALLGLERFLRSPAGRGFVKVM